MSRVATVASPAGQETYADYLRRVGDDYRESGSESTAHDYAVAADATDLLVRALTRIARSTIKGEPTLAALVARDTLIKFATMVGAA